MCYNLVSMDDIQQRQEDQYTFPYHYIPRWGERFTQTRTMRWGYEYASYIEFVIDLLVEHYKPRRLLDVGCGDGRFIYEAKKHLRSTSFSGVDYSNQAINFARAFNPDVSFFAEDITDLSLDIGLYDSVVLIETLEHIPPAEIPKFLEAVMNLLEKDGILIITVPSTNVPLSKKHYQHFDKSKLENVLPKNASVIKWQFLNKEGLQSEIIKWILSNRIFAITSTKISTWIYRYYTKYLLRVQPHNCRIILLVVRKI